MHSIQSYGIMVLNVSPFSTVDCQSYELIGEGVNITEQYIRSNTLN